ncbi:NADH-quinone oxidoreductase subunit L [Rickettsiales endosymbiont of Stachyamoeba lipophora]|uniref:NADH-quinone oxidoreductase subunit L n=1 Tax=Rickettsiales endosymbiont of Stachyamoeba lipophora TaxID=2486578 RepID=UPI000F6488CF|nr:NADH-quinone oxidoreductase subunit L [Rickettsiales endosymbiont of Stachyamoeba lipophora]AZL15997.1 NADH-quinone oxidoreductase subunit L [Rickettsiales endosymbiont of Stachyamoeba lipophora]
MHPLWLFTPLIASIIVGCFSNRLTKSLAQIITILGVSVAFIASLYFAKEILLDGAPATLYRLTNWFNLVDFSVKWTINVDSLSVIMLVVVTSVSLMVHIYSVGYMQDDPHVARFMAYLSLFTFAMTVLVTASNLIQLFLGWEGVGACSYLLIGFWYKKRSAYQAAMKAFIVNRVGDFCFIIGIAAIYLIFDSVKFSTIFNSLNDIQFNPISFFGYQINAIDFACIALFLGCMGKSAQIGLHVWLPDAMEGPTPVSALIHAATMVTAGVFLVIRFSPLFELSQIARDFMLIIGSITAVFAASIALVQNDIKKIIAYSTCSQLGYMFIACGLSVYNVALFHLATHAFFKALLFLSAGNIIHSVNNEQDINKMGNLWRKIPVTYSMFWIGSLAIAGFPPFAGFYSKEAILESAYMSHSSYGHFAYLLGIIAATFTAFYSWRLIFKVFHGRANYDHKISELIHESPLIMLLPLGVLAIGAIFSGYYGANILNMIDYSLSLWKDAIVILPEHNILDELHHTPTLYKYLPMVLSIGGILVAYKLYLTRSILGEYLFTKLQKIHHILYNKYFFDELYHRLFTHNWFNLSHFAWKHIDIAIIDQYGPSSLVKISKFLSEKFSKFQNGYIFHYALVMLFSAVAIISWYVIKLV